MRLVIARTEELPETTLTALRAVFDAAFDDRFTDNDWLHALGGTHFFLESEGAPLAHASVVQRSLEVHGRFYETGYVEAVCTDPVHQGRGHGSTVMRAAGDHVLEAYELGALATGENEFYERLGWETWRGPTGVRTAQGAEPTPSEDGNVMILRTPTSQAIDTTGAITCEWRPGDAW